MVVINMLQPERNDSMEKTHKGRKVMTISLQNDLYEAFTAICMKQNLNRSATIASYVARFVKSEQKTRNKSVTKSKTN